MNPITVTVTGRLGDDPRTFTTRDGTTGVELRLALDLPSRVPGGDGVTRWVKVTAFGMLAERTAASVGKGDRGTAGTGEPAGPGDRRVDGLRQPAHRVRRPQGGPAGRRERGADRSPGW
jgi:hypothetical protein